MSSAGASLSSLSSTCPSYLYHPYVHLDVHHHTPHSPYPVFAISVDLGTIAATTEPLVWTMGMTRDPAVTYTGASGAPQPRSPYWASQFNQPLDAVRIRPSPLPNSFGARYLHQCLLPPGCPFRRRLPECGRPCDGVGPAHPRRCCGRRLVGALCRSRVPRCTAGDGWDRADYRAESESGCVRI